MSEPQSECGSRTSAETDDLYRALANRRRRIAIRILQSTSGDIEVHSLARGTAGREFDETAERVGDDRIERVAVSLHHVHLPKLADLGIVDYDPENGRVRGPRRDVPV